MLANPVKAVCAPFEIPTAELWPDTEGVASKVAVKVPLCEGKAELFQTPLAVAVEQTTAGFTCRLTVLLWLRLPLAPVMVSVYVAAGVVLAVAQLTVEDPEPPLIAGALQLAPLGTPLTVRLTLPLNPLLGATVAV